VQLVSEYTRYISNRDPSLLDHIYLSRPELGKHCITEWGTSDYRLIELRKKLKGPLPCETRIRKRTFKHFSRKHFMLKPLNGTSLFILKTM